MKKALIIAGGEYSLVTSLNEYDYIIACDKGVLYAKEMNLIPNLIMGDFDSFEGNIKDLYQDVPVEVHPVVKDDTDTMLAIKHALSHGYKNITIACALGLRMDHTISNLQSLHFIAKSGGVGEIISSTEHLITIGPNASLVVSRKENRSLSVYSLTDKSKKVCISGATYSVSDITLKNSFPLGHGNSIADREAKISVGDGILLIVESKM